MTDTNRPSIADAELEAAMSEVGLDEPIAFDWDEPVPSDRIDFATRVPPQSAVATIDVGCGDCHNRGDTTTMLHIRLLALPRASDLSNVEIVVVGARERRTDPAILIHGDGRESEVLFPEPPSRIDRYSAFSASDVSWPFSLKCHRCGHSLRRGLGRHKFERLCQSVQGPVLL